MVVCPGNTTTGGPEALHYLVHSLGELGLNAFIVYTPYGCHAGVPAAYKDFQIKVGGYDDSVGNLIIFAETMPSLALGVKKAQSAVWWLSVDGFTERRYANEFRNQMRYWRLALTGRRPWRKALAFTKTINFAQSEYAHEYLRKHGLPAIRLFEPINPSYILDETGLDQNQRKNIILYNPKKGMSTTRGLISRFPYLDFIPLQGLDKSGLLKIFSTSKIYIDFGHHPGKDRMPREAAIHGCCVITGLKGSAKNSVDIPIPQKYKLDENSQSFQEDFSCLVDGVFQGFSGHFSNFAGYRNQIRAEPHIFRRQISRYFLDTKSILS